ncbi:MAG: GspE/PulE family protein [bacterium]|nr:GspE/PulE family protein [bacterium]
MLISNDELKQLVLRTGLIAEEKINELEQFAKDSSTTLEDMLIERDVISDENLGILIADFLKIPFIVLTKTSIPEEVYHIVPEKLARKQKVIAFGRDTNGVKLAMVDPRNTTVQEMIARKTGSKVATYYATERDIYNTLKIYRKDLQKSFEELMKDFGKYAEPPVSKIVDMVIDYAYQDRASDIHIEINETESLARFRIDGMLHDMLRMPKHLHDQVIARIKVLSRLRTDEHLSPQDGKMRMRLEEEDLDLRVSILPIVEGEKVVLRLLASHFRQFSLVDLGMNEKDLTKVQKAISKSFGMVLSTGPTGSGKTTSIYSLIKILNTREKNITTIEDPVEYRIKGINQIQVNVKTNLTFASGLRSILRQDPNVVFVGEIRDNETASIAVNAALTGHLVLSTLHTNDAATTLPRLTDMKIEPFLVASTVNVIIAQRLIRKICEMCKVSLQVHKAELTRSIPDALIVKHFGSADVITVYQGQGCKVCNKTGYMGRVGVFEVLEVTNTVRKLITEKRDADVIAQAAIAEGMSTMLDDGLNKIAKGVTTLAEVLRVTKVES